MVFLFPIKTEENEFLHNFQCFKVQLHFAHHMLPMSLGINLVFFQPLHKAWKYVCEAIELGTDPRKSSNFIWMWRYNLTIWMWSHVSDITHLTCERSARQTASSCLSYIIWAQPTESTAPSFVCGCSHTAVGCAQCVWSSLTWIERAERPKVEWVEINRVIYCAILV